MLSDRSLEKIKSMSPSLTKPVRLVLFTADTGCETCPDMADLARAIKAQYGKIVLETYDVVMDRDKSEQYKVKQAPALVVQGSDGQFVTFYGLIEDVLLELLLVTIEAVSKGQVWLPDDARRALAHLVHDVPLRVYVESDCAQCRPVAATAISLGLASRLISASIIVASDFPDLMKRYSISVLPKTIFGENLHLDGHVKESEFLEMIFQAEGLKTGTDKKCLVCGTPSSDMICANCKTKIQAEAVEHKLKGEKLRQPERS